ncbi:DUF6364 family protein [Neolewinella persica]|uniref:DUF6364 family protein n=1 Tax=Neolewinella persica TaxID=70998 RepID=UPI0003782DBF|nr:DUF6364 family protein [Neolewinella persica]
MAATKLTLRLDDNVIERGKAFAKEQGTSLSKLIEQFLSEVAPPIKQEHIAIEPDPDILALMIPRKTGGSFAGNADELGEYYDAVSTNHLSSEVE